MITLYAIIHLLMLHLFIMSAIFIIYAFFGTNIRKDNPARRICGILPVITFIFSFLYYKMLFYPE